MFPDILRIQGIEDPFPAEQGPHTSIGCFFLVRTIFDELLGQFNLATKLLKDESGVWPILCRGPASSAYSATGEDLEEREGTAIEPILYCAQAYLNFGSDAICDFFTQSNSKRYRVR